MQKFNFTQKGTWSQFVAKLNGMFNQKADKTEIPAIPTALPNPQAITFSGILPEVSYDGTQAVNVALPTPEMMEESVGTPVGEIISFMGNTAPKNYLKCDGTVYNIADYPELAQHFVTELGASNHFGGDGETTFAVPDLRGEFLRGTGANGHGDSGNGAEVGVHQKATNIFQCWSGDAIVFPHNAGETMVANSNSDTLILKDSRVISGNASQEYSNTVGISTVRPTNTSVLYCIKYKSEHFIQVGGVNYSLEERKTGTWIDGKPLYEKTINFGNLPNATTKEVPHGIENVDEIWVYDGLIHNPVYNSVLQTVFSNSSVSGANGFNTYVDSQNVTIACRGNSLSQSGLIVLRYTKTTDSAVVS